MAAQFSMRLTVVPLLLMEPCQDAWDRAGKGTGTGTWPWQTKPAGERKKLGLG